ncbi:hypothetical protein [Thermogemmatispora tikiterensis]|uniref:Uncharacterized protein n=1 Tax=Thermogemmatispora tikiterensis TaxID=1825093 RepID=A0A328VEW7_9CHLR|nr:hypothetical protein [Thermogemmatispora tikiterensis]RAQ94083.1 hypothetical protein A4R35_00965 [Thermogemmatispora tikiterensis]
MVYWSHAEAPPRAMFSLAGRNASERTPLPPLLHLLGGRRYLWIGGFSLIPRPWLKHMRWPKQADVWGSRGEKQRMEKDLPAPGLRWQPGPLLERGKQAISNCSFLLAFLDSSKRQEL